MARAGLHMEDWGNENSLIALSLSLSLSLSCSYECRVSLSMVEWVKASLNQRKQKQSESGLRRKSAQLASHEQVEHPHLSHWVSFGQSCGWVKENFITTACDPVRPLWDQSNNHIMHHSHTTKYCCIVVNSFFFSHPSYFSHLLCYSILALYIRLYNSAALSLSLSLSLFSFLSCISSLSHFVLSQKSSRI